MRYFVIIFLTGISFALISCSYTEPEGGFVRRQWSDSIARLSIIPTYPPNEDIQIGDIYAVEALTELAKTEDDRNTARENIAFAKIGYSAPALEAAERYYRDRILFAPTEPGRPEDNAKQKSVGPNVSTASASRRELWQNPPEMALPGYTIARGFVAQFAGSLPAQAFGLIFGTSHIQDSILEVQVTKASTYSLPLLQAMNHLDHYCSNKKCNGRELASYMTRSSSVRFNNNNAYRTSIECAVPMMISEVFMTRDITYVYALTNANATRITAAAATQTSQSYVEALQKLAEVNITLPASAKPQEEALSTRDSIMQALLTNLNNDISNLSASQPSGAFTFVSYSTNRLTLKQTFKRPIVFGYNAVFANDAQHQCTDVAGLPTPVIKATGAMPATIRNTPASGGSNTVELGIPVIRSIRPDRQPSLLDNLQ